MRDLNQQADAILAKFGDQPIFNLTLKDFLTVTRAVVQAEPQPKEAVKYFTRRDIMETFGVSYVTIVDHEKRGLLNSNKRIGHKHLYSQEDIDNYLEKIPKAPCCKL